MGIDCFSKWVVIHPLRSKSAEEIRDWFYCQFLPQYGKPQWIRFDASKEFEGAFASMCDGTGITVCQALAGYARSNGQVERFNREIKTAIRKYMGMNPGSFWWDWLPEVLTGLHICVCRSHGHSPFFLLYKQDQVVLAQQVEPDERFPISWDIDTDVEGELAKQLCCAFEAARLDCVAKMKAADLASKSYHDCTTLLLGVTFAVGETVYRRQHRIGKLLPRTEGPYEFRRYANALCTSAVVCNPHMQREVRIHSSLLVRA